ncbi:MAG: hypothetical protein ABIB72_02685 [Candidatus Falkowbacteria bacterium]
MNTKFKSILTILGIYAGSIFLAIIFASGFGVLHSIFFGTTCVGSMFIMSNINEGCRIEGFIYSFIFWLSIFSFVSLKKKTAWINFVLGTFLFWVLFIYIIISENIRRESEIVGSLVIMLISFAAGYAIAFGIKKLQKSKD